jgi:hypothetical protein
MTVFTNVHISLELFLFVLIEVTDCSLFHRVYVFIQIVKYLPCYSSAYVAMQGILNDSALAVCQVL